MNFHYTACFTNPRNWTHLNYLSFFFVFSWWIDFQWNWLLAFAPDDCPIPIHRVTNIWVDTMMSLGITQSALSEANTHNYLASLLYVSATNKQQQSSIHCFEPLTCTNQYFYFHSIDNVMQLSIFLNIFDPPPPITLNFDSDMAAELLRRKRNSLNYQ